jgi:hypothetical protein
MLPPDPAASPMCDQCNSFNEIIDRYKWLRNQTSDEQTRQAAAELINELEAKKVALRPE